jgi:hypothetical protein
MAANLNTNLVPGAAYKRRKFLPTIIPCHTVPDIHTDTIVIGVCGTPIQEADSSDHDGWFISDFCAFNYLLKGLGSRQTWFSAASEQDLLEFIDGNLEMRPGFLHGNPFHDRKIVFNRDLVQQGELTPFTVCESTEIVPTLLSEIHFARELSKRTNPPTPILLLLFGHGTQSLGIHLDYSKTIDDPAGLFTIGHLQSAVDSSSHITLITTACYSGGWAICPDLNMTILTAAGAWEGEHELISETYLSQAWNDSASISRACGSIFATTLIDSLTQTTSPLLQSSPSPQEEAVSGGSNSLQPSTATEVQTETYNEFCRSVVRTLGENVTRRPNRHEFRFAAQDDEWAQCWFARTGIPLGHFQQRWDQAPVYKTTTPNDFTNLDPLNPLWSSSAAGSDGPRSRTGGSAAMSASAPNLLREDAHSPGFFRRKMQANAAMLGNSCPGDWNRSPNRRIRGMLRDYARGGEFGLKHESFLIKVMLFRLQTAEFVDTVVSNYRLIQPLGQTCLFWDKERWLDLRPEKGQKWRDISHHMSQEGVVFREHPSQGDGFTRGNFYLGASIFDSNLNSDTAVSVIREIGKCLREGAHGAEQSLISQSSVRDRARLSLGVPTLEAINTEFR